MENVLSAAENAEIESVFLEVRASNAAAIALYEKHGFAAVGRRRGYYDAPVEDAAVMRWGK
jgi:ribosomal-protein-alanine N-acetyltransferase